ncbi:SDR family NAD(P)-dependent oxidoreductase [Aeromicrobium sp. CF3.5]|uniref:SDR family NAD(P)-dependent oxidoreductase n=1 Tax=Aeromicrobium sp. CF3.5 TaxID=3373078 RepID=UPI003EE81B17
MSGRPLALVTGVGGGIGLGVARMLAGRGYDIVAVDLDSRGVDRAVAELGPQTIGVISDAGVVAEVEALAERISGEWAERLEIVVCNAGVIYPGDVVDAQPEAFRTQVDVMLASPMRLIAAAASVMAPRGRGHLLATVSMGGVLALPGSAAYSASKAGLRAFLTALSAELRDSGVVVSGVFPSGVDTPMLRAEALHGGSVLNFVGKVLSVDDVVRGYEKALDSRRLEVFVPRTDGVFARLMAFAPQLGNKALPALEALGRKGHAHYLQTMTPDAASYTKD